MTRILEILLMTLGGVWQGARQDFNLAEIALVAWGIFAWRRGELPRLGRRSSLFRPGAPALFEAWRRRPWIAAIAIALGTIALRLALLPLLHAPVPVVSDEFSHLLLADTFVDGRITNPTHPLWQFFETLHVIQQPHYTSDYFPGHAAVLAAARLAMGSAWAGILFECCAFLLALYWMLAGWMPSRWALAGVAIAALRFGIGSYWVNAYHGGFLPAMGGALIAGAFVRLMGGRVAVEASGWNRDRVSRGYKHFGPTNARRSLWSRFTRGRVASSRMVDDGVVEEAHRNPLPMVTAQGEESRDAVAARANGAHVGYGVVFGIGLAILAMTRPFEGVLYSAPWVVMLAWKLRWSVMRAAIPAVAIAGAAVVAMAFYFGRVTGSPVVTAYQVNQKAYGWPMGLAWTKPPKIEFRHVELQRYYEYELGEREKVDGPLDFVEFLTFRVQEYWRFFLGPVLTVPLIAIGAVWRRKRVLIIGLAGAVFAVLLEGAASPHYLAPATAVIVAIVIECCRHLHARRVPIIGMAMIAMTLVLGLRIAAQDFGLPYTQALNYQSWCCKVQGNMNKARVTRELERVPGKHLVFVKTKTDPNNLLQWVYNSADIDGSRIVWARDLGAERDAELVKYFGDRDVWMVDPNCEPAGLERVRVSSEVVSGVAGR